MKTLNVISNTFCAWALLVMATFAAPSSLTAQLPNQPTQLPNQAIRIMTLPPALLQQLAAFTDTRPIDFPPQNLSALLNSTVGNTFKVPADGTITLKLKFDHKGNLPINHTVRIELRNPNNVVVKTINEFIVKHNLITTATLTAVASKELSGCSGLNMWSYKVINNDNVNHQSTLVDASAIIPDATGERSTYPAGSYTLTQNQFGDYVFKTPVGHRGRVRIKVRYTTGTQIEARLFRPGVEPAPNEANYAAIKNITETNQYLDFNFGSGSVDTANEFWTVRLRSKSAQTMNNVHVKVEFTDCSE